MTTTVSTRAEVASRPRRIWRVVWRVVLVLILIPVVLVPVYWIVPPVSLLMITARIFHGPIERTYVPLSEIAPSLVASVVMSEDGQYCSHWGVDWQELSKVLDRSKGPNRGASTIPMQTVKNLFLWTSRSYVRKALEIPLALYADLLWSKRRTMEIYLNIAEFGPGIFGAEAAAQHYFKRSAKALTAGQSALLTVTLPDPADRNPAKPSRYMAAHARAVAARARASGAYTACIYP